MQLIKVNTIGNDSSIEQKPSKGGVVTKAEHQELQDTLTVLREQGKKNKTKDSLYIVTAIITILFAIGTIFGGLTKYIEFSSQLVQTSKQVEITAKAVDELQKWKVKIDTRDEYRNNTGIHTPHKE